DVLRSGAVKRGALTLFKCSSGTGGKHAARRTTHPSGLRSPKPAAIVSCPGWLSGALNWTSAVRRIAARRARGAILWRTERPFVFLGALVVAHITVNLVVGSGSKRIVKSRAPSGRVQ